MDSLAEIVSVNDWAAWKQRQKVSKTVRQMERPVQPFTLKEQEGVLFKVYAQGRKQVLR